MKRNQVDRICLRRPCTRPHCKGQGKSLPLLEAPLSATSVTTGADIGTVLTVH